MTNTLKQHWHEALAIPAIVTVVTHTHTGLGFDPWLGWTFAGFLAAVVWSAWLVVTSRTLRHKRWLWYAALVAALAGSGVEAVLMYQSKGHTIDPQYTVAKAHYDRELAAFDADAQRKATAQQLRVDALQAQIEEIKDTGKLTSRRADMTRLTEELGKVSAQQAKTFDLAAPAPVYKWNMHWLFVTLVTVVLTPLAYVVLAGMRVKEEDTVATVTVTSPTVTAENSVTVATVTVTPPTVTDENDVTVGVTVHQNVNSDSGALNGENSADSEGINATKNTSELSDTAVLIVASRITALPVGAAFHCPCCGAEAVKTRKDRTTCGSGICRVRLQRVKDRAPTVVSFAKSTQNQFRKPKGKTSHGK